jgi:hypothetical protein
VACAARAVVRDTDSDRLKNVDTPFVGIVAAGVEAARQAAREPVSPRIDKRPNRARKPSLPKWSREVDNLPHGLLVA